jgi:hypothetical protein
MTWTDGERLAQQVDRRHTGLRTSDHHASWREIAHVCHVEVVGHD